MWSGFVVWRHKGTVRSRRPHKVESVPYAVEVRRVSGRNPHNAGKMPRSRALTGVKSPGLRRFRLRIVGTRRIRNVR